MLSKPQGKTTREVGQGVDFKNNTSKKHPTKGGRPNLKSMYEFTWMPKPKVMIHNEIMIHFGHPKPIANNQMPYSNDECHTLKDKHKLDKMFFPVLDSELNDDFFLKKTRA